MATPSPALLARLREAAQDPTKRDAVFAAIAADPVLGPELDDLSDEDLIAASATVAANPWMAVIGVNSSCDRTWINSLLVRSNSCSSRARPSSPYIVAHRDTNFAFLRHLGEDEEIAVEDMRGRVTRYRVREVTVVDQSATRLLDPADSPQLTLITCWPFDAVRPGSAQRYVVIADRA